GFCKHKSAGTAPEVIAFGVGFRDLSESRGVASGRSEKPRLQRRAGECGRHFSENPARRDPAVSWHEPASLSAIEATLAGTQAAAARGSDQREGLCPGIWLLAHWRGFPQ